jgi:hypothetical protein
VTLLDQKARRMKPHSLILLQRNRDLAVAVQVAALTPHLDELASSETKIVVGRMRRRAIDRSVPVLIPLSRRHVFTP